MPGDTIQRAFAAYLLESGLGLLQNQSASEGSNAPGMMLP